ncbi:hypothetical protein HK096_007308, partial [Nowakowskiella sp. JEL0078]
MKTTQGETSVAKSSFVYDIKTNTTTESVESYPRFLHSSVLLTNSSSPSSVILFGINSTNQDSTNSEVITLDSSSGSILGTFNSAGPGILTGAACTNVNSDIYCFGGQEKNDAGQKSLSSKLWKLTKNGSWILLWDDTKKSSSSLKKRHYKYDSCGNWVLIDAPDAPCTGIVSGTPVTVTSVPTSSSSVSASQSSSSGISGSSTSLKSSIISAIPVSSSSLLTGSSTILPATPTTPSLSTQTSSSPLSIPTTFNNIYPSGRWLSTLTSVNNTILVIWGGGAPSENITFEGNGDISYQDSNIYFFDLTTGKWTSKDDIVSKLGSNLGNANSGTSSSSSSQYLWVILVVFFLLILLPAVFVLVKKKRDEKKESVTGLIVPGALKDDEENQLTVMRDQENLLPVTSYENSSEVNDTGSGGYTAVSILPDEEDQVETKQ